MPINYDTLKEGDALDASSLNDRFGVLGGTALVGVNALGAEDIERQALRREHLPSLLKLSDFPNGLSKLGPVTTPAVLQIYDTRLNIGMVGVPLLYLTTFGALGGTPPYGPNTGGPDDGWRIIATNGVVADAAEITFPALSAAAGRIGDYEGLLIRLGVGHIDIRSTAQATTAMEKAVVFGIGIENSLGVRSVIERSIRWVGSEVHIRGSLETFVFLQASDVPGGVRSIFGVIAGGNFDRNRNQTIHPIIDFYNIDITPIVAGDLD